MWDQTITNYIVIFFKWLWLLIVIDPIPVYVCQEDTKQ